MHAEVIAIANQKGGVGKTTTTLTLGAALTRLGKSVLILDLDPHACASLQLKVYAENQDKTLYDIFTHDKEEWPKIWKEIVKPSEIEQLYLAPGCIRLSELEIDLYSRKGKGLLLKQALTLVTADYDYVLLDCPPHVGILLINALVCADFLIIPIQTDVLALHGLKLLFNTIRTLNKVLEKPIRYKALPTLYDRRAKACKKILELIQAKMKDSVFNTVIGLDTRFREASALGCSIYNVDPKSQGARAYEALAKEVVKL